MGKIATDVCKRKSSSSRGYAGWYRETVYLRSLKEYLVARFLDHKAEKYPSLSYRVEVETFNVDGVSYRPDFFLYREGSLWGILEVKDFGQGDVAREYLKRFREFFREKGLHYYVIHKERHYGKIKRTVGITREEIEAWKKASTYDYSGKNNPRYGVKVSEETKRKIGAATAARLSDPEWRAYHRERSAAANRKPEYRERASSSARARWRKQAEDRQFANA